MPKLRSFYSGMVPQKLLEMEGKTEIFSRFSKWEKYPEDVITIISHNIFMTFFLILSLIKDTPRAKWQLCGRFPF